MEKELIIEIGTEEVPARFIRNYAEDFAQRVLSFIMENRLSSTKRYELYFTPRRVIFIKKDVKDRQEDEEREIIGPPVRVCFDSNGNPQKALFSFLQKYNIPDGGYYKTPSEKGEVVAAKVRIEGKEATELLKTALPDILSSIKFKKSMRWGDYNISFIRPVRWIVAIYGQEVIPFEFAGVKSAKRSFGNFNLDCEGFEVKGRDTFLTELRSRGVIYDVEERKKIIIDELKMAFERNQADYDIDNDLLDEVSNILEYPVPVEGRFEDCYLSLPSELLEVVERHHQRYFPLKRGKKVLPFFVAFANNPQGDRELIRKGMEKVLRARLNDAVFFFNEDKKRGIESMAKALNMVLYQRGLGNYDHKTERVIKLSRFIAESLNLTESEIRDIEEVARLSKADLVSLTVGEFPELQGIMGKYLALYAGYSEVVARAIEEHYKPLISGGEIPQGICGKVVAIADKMDHIAGLFLINQKPSASSDPFGIRRAASGIIDIMRFSGFKDILLSSLVKKSIEQFDIDEIKRFDSKITINQAVESEILDYLRMRIKSQLTEEIKPDVAEAILNSESGIEDIPSIFERMDALLQYIKEPDFEKFAVVYKRACNITKEFEELRVDSNLFEYPEERELYNSIDRIRDEFKSYLRARDYFNAMRLLKENLYGPVFKFFDRVYVMVEDEAIRRNRLALLKNVVVMFRKIIDLSFISSMQV